MRGKQSIVHQEWSFAASLSDYREHHVVSQHAALVIKSFSSTQMSESAEADEEEVARKQKSLSSQRQHSGLFWIRSLKYWEAMTVEVLS